MKFEIKEKYNNNINNKNKIEEKNDDDNKIEMEKTANTTNHGEDADGQRGGHEALREERVGPHSCYGWSCCRILVQCGTNETNSLLKGRGGAYIERQAV